MRIIQVAARIRVPETVRERLRSFGHEGMTDADILAALMDRIQREDFVRDLRASYLETPRHTYVNLENL